MAESTHNRSLASERDSSPLTKILDATLLLAGVSAFLYFVNVLFEEMFYARFGISGRLLTFPLPETFMACPSVGLTIMILYTLTVWLHSIRGRSAAVKAYTDRTFFILMYFNMIALLLIASALGVGLLEGSDTKSHPEKTTATFILSGKEIKGYSLLGRNADSYFFFKTNGTDKPTVLIAGVAEVHDLVLRGEILQVVAPAIPSTNPTQPSAVKP